MQNLNIKVFGVGVEVFSQNKHGTFSAGGIYIYSQAVDVDLLAVKGMRERGDEIAVWRETNKMDSRLLARRPGPRYGQRKSVVFVSSVCCTRAANAPTVCRIYSIPGEISPTARSLVATLVPSAPARRDVYFTYF